MDSQGPTGYMAVICDNCERESLVLEQFSHNSACIFEIIPVVTILLVALDIYFPLCARQMSDCLGTMTKKWHYVTMVPLHSRVLWCHVKVWYHDTSVLGIHITPWYHGTIAQNDTMAHQGTMAHHGKLYWHGTIAWYHGTMDYHGIMAHQGTMVGV